MNLIDIQIAREEHAVARGVDRFLKVLNEDKAKGREFEGPVGQTMTRRVLQDLVPVVKDLQRKARAKVVAGQTTGERLTGWEMPVCLMSAEEMAFITLKTVLITEPRRCIRQGLARRIGNMCNLQVMWGNVTKAEKARVKEGATEPGYNRIQVMKRQVKAVNPRSVKKWLKKLDDLTTEDWNNELKVKIGAPLLECLVIAAPDVFEVEHVHHTSMNRHAIHMMIRMTDEHRALLEAEYDTFGEANPWLEPTLAPPLNWKWHENRFVGGYYRQLHHLVKHTTSLHTHSIVAPDTIPEVVLDALNRVQRTSWAINRSVLACAKWGAYRGITAVLPVEPIRPMPDDVPESVWEAMTEGERGKIRNERRQVHDHNYRLEAKRWSMRRQLTMASSLVAEGRPFYFPHNLDFRGRAYPIPQDLHPQSDDFGRAMLTFSEGKPLGPNGLQWLVFHMANCYGMDKASRADQMEWYNENLDAIYSVASDPFGAGLDFWLLADAKHRWQFLAAAIEVCAAAAHPVDPSFFLSHLPVHVDGSCNGLQHLSAMGRDPVGAHATNLTADPARQDIYQIVADKVNASLDAHVGWGDELPERGVMTMPYGLTPIGMRDQLIDDRWTADLEGDDYKNAGYLRDLMLGAIEGTVKAASETMAWMQDNATILAKNNCPVEWWAPSGFKVRQCYRVPNWKRVNTVMGASILKMRVIVDDTDQPLRVSKQASSIAPNIIHSFDAAHMMQSISASPEGLSFSIIHDSFGVHACDMPLFLQHVKQEFVGIYMSNWFASLQEDFETSRGTAEFPLIDQPTPGAWNPDEVLQSEFFFA
jgi:DNA-directed RNA polymerase